MKPKIKILLADDDPVLCRLLPLQLAENDFSVAAVKSGRETLAELRREDFDVVLLDVNLPDVSGLEILPAIRQTADAPEVVMLTADESLSTGITAMRRGAYDYLTKPAAAEQIEAVARKAFEKRQLARQNERLRAAVNSQNQTLAIEPVHQSETMRKIFAQAAAVAKLDSTVLITGESGTGKDVLARWLHSRSARAALPFISVNCGALPENLFESEFFGHEKGSFTGATTQKIGLVEAADGSTLFLDEVGEMPLPMQVKLLHFLENGAFRRVGATRDRSAEVRVIAATNRPLEDDIKAKKFRADLFYRLNVITFELPPLRERREDLPALIEFFLHELRRRFHRPRLALSEKARRELENHPWHGNVRELRNMLERAAALSTGDTITEIFGLSREKAAPDSAPSVSDTFMPLAEIEKKHILRVLDAVAGKREKAAQILGITARTLYRKLNEYGVRRD